MSRSPVCLCEHPLLELDDSRVPHCVRCGREIHTQAATKLVQLIRRSVGDSIALAPETVEQLAHRVAELLREGPPAPARHILTADEVAVRIGRSRDFVYAHASELGARPMGAGPRPRLAFDAEAVDRFVAPPEPEQKPKPRRRPQRGSAPPDLLPIRGQRAA